MVIRPDVELANISDVGCQRAQNEDYFIYCEPPDDAVFAERGRLLVVADGMGGHRGGSIASRLAAETMRDTFCNHESSQALKILVAGFERSHHAIADSASRDLELEGMGTTCSAAILKYGQLTIGHVGDTRIYIIRDTDAILLTQDHTVSEQLARAGKISAAEARAHESRHVLTAALGANSEIAAEFSENAWQLKEQDIVLLCSDGLHGLLEDSELPSMVRQTTMYDASRAMVNLAKARGGPDNITLQLLRIWGMPR